MNRLKAFTSIWCFILLSSSVMALDLKPYQLQLKAKRFGTVNIVLKGSQSLKFIANNQWQFSLTTNSSFFKFKEISTFYWQNHVITPLQYVSNSSVAFSRKYQTINFDHNKNTIAVRSKKRSKNFPYQQDIMDPGSFQIKLMSDLKASEITEFKYHIQEFKRQTEYQFDIVENTWIKTPMGYVKTYKLRQILTSHPKEKKYYWVAEQFGFIPVLIENYENNKLISRIEVTSGTYDNKKITGLKNRPNLN